MQTFVRLSEVETPQSKSPIFVELLVEISPFGRNDKLDVRRER